MNKRSRRGSHERGGTYSGRISDVRKSLADGKGGRELRGGCCVPRGRCAPRCVSAAGPARLASDFFLDEIERDGDEKGRKC